MGPAALLHAYWWIADTRDGQATSRLRALKEGGTRMWECKTIANCASVCQKHLNPALLIHRMKKAALEWERDEQRQARRGWTQAGDGAAGGGAEQDQQAEVE